MAFNLNPLGIVSPNRPANAAQPDYRIPVVSPFVASYSVGADMLGLGLTSPAAKTPQPGTSNPSLASSNLTGGTVQLIGGPLGVSKVVFANGTSQST